MLERFVALIQHEPFDYTKWREGLFEELTLEDISKKAMTLREEQSKSVKKTGRAKHTK